MFLRLIFLASLFQGSLAISQEEISVDLTLDQYLQQCGYNPSPEGSGDKDNYAIEGYSTEAQRLQFVERVKLHPNITTALEIGLNAGHSADNFLKNCPNLKRLVSIDINWHPYTAHAARYLTFKYQDRFGFIAGDSLIKVPELAKLHPDQKFDLIFIDGNHDYMHCMLDILNARALSRSNALIFIDDSDNPSVQQAVRKCQLMKVIAVHGEFHSHDNHGSKSWIEAHFIER